MRSKKIRGDSKLMHLHQKNPKQHEQLVEWLLGGMTYDKVVLLLEQKPFYIETSTRALSEFYQEFCLEPFLARRQANARIASGIRKEAEKSPSDFDKATLDLLELAAFEMAKSQAMDVKSVKSLLMLLLKRRDQDAKAETLKFEKEKFKTSLLKKIDLGMQELFEQIKDNPKALAAFESMKAEVSKK